MAPSSGPGGVANRNWRDLGGGDGFSVVSDPNDSDIVYLDSQGARIVRVRRSTGENREINPFAAAGDAKLRFNWNTPIYASPTQKGMIYIGAQQLYRSKDRGDSWERISPDLTTNDQSRQKQLESGGLTVDNSSAENYTTIITINESSKNPNVLWVGTDDGNLQVTRDGGKTWKNVASKVPGVPKGTYVSRVVASKTAEGTAFATFDGHRADDYNVYIFATTDFGESWKAIRNGIPDSAGTAHVVREHPRNTNLLFAGTEFGLWVSWDRGANWTALKSNFPTVPVDDIEIQARENDLVLATHGRSIWIFDDLTPIEKMDANVANLPLTFFPPRTATTWFIRQRRWSAGQQMFTAKNPAYGALLTYYLKDAIPPEAPKTNAEAKTDAAEQRPRRVARMEATAEKKEGKVKITVTDKDGKAIREFDGPGAAGMNRTNWDLRQNPAAEPTPEQLEAIAAGFGFGPRGPLVEPGEYAIKIKAGDKEASQKVTVEDDNRITISAADRAARHEAIEKLYAM